MIAYNSRITTSGLINLWDAKNPKSYPGSGATWTDMVAGVPLTIVGGVTYDPNGFFSFGTNQTTQSIINAAFPFPTQNSTVECWFRFRSNAQWQVPYSYQVGTVNTNSYLTMIDSTTLIFFINGTSTSLPISSNTNVWYNITRTRTMSTGLNSVYVNGVMFGQSTIGVGAVVPSGGIMAIGQEPDADAATNYGFDSSQNLDGEFAYMGIYDRALTDDEVMNNFIAMRGRYSV